MALKEPVFPPRLLECYRELEKMELPVAAVALDGAAVASWDGKSPLLESAPPLIDSGRFAAVARQVFELLAAHLPEMEKDLQRLGEKLPAGTADRAGLVHALINRDGRAVTFMRDYGEIAPDVFGFAFSHVLRIFLGTYARRLHEKVNFERWGRGICPVCGSKPIFSRLDRTGRRFLYCGLCGTEWRFVRAACPFCGNTAPEKLGFYLFEKGLYRVYVCNGCRGYLKTLDERAADCAVANLFWEDIKTVPLDMTVLRLGFLTQV
ncbi:MAG: formate dehydrogenase accessory protein FdhE [Bacillota bacterium]